MAQVNVESLRVVNGVIDVDAIELLERPFGDTNAALQRMSDVLASARSPWLVAPVGDRVDQLADEVDELVEQTDRAVAAVQLAPSMLGRDGPRTYFVAFTTPAEARGLGGFMGTWAELRADDGRLDGRSNRSDRRADGGDACRAAGARRPGRLPRPLRALRRRRRRRAGRHRLLVERHHVTRLPERHRGVRPALPGVRRDARSTAPSPSTSNPSPGSSS